MRGGLLLAASFVLLFFGVLRLFETSAIEWLRNMVAPYALIEIPIFFAGVFLWFFAWTDRLKTSLLVAFLAVIALWVVAGGF